MTSKNLFFKLMKEDLKRRMWAIALISLGFFFFYPVVAAFTAGEIKDYTDYARGLAKYEDGLARWLSFNCGMTVFLMVTVSLICGLSSFSFLNSKSKVDFYHGIPVRREKLFAANFLNGILILAIPYGVCQVMAVLVGISNGANGSRLWQVALAAYGFHITYYILMYSTVVVAAMMTGHLVIGFLGAVVFACYMPMATGLLVGYLTSFFKTYAANMPGILSERFLMYGIRLSPFSEYIYQLSRNGEQYQNPVSMVGAILVSWMVSILLAALSCFLYRKRPSEAAGKAMAFSVTCPVVRILLTILSAMGLGVFFYAVRESTGWMIFGILFGGGICHCVVEIIYHFDFRKLFSHKLQLAGCLAVSMIIMAVFRYDLLGYDRYLPKAGQVREASVSIGGITNWVSYGHTEKFPDGHYEWVSESSGDYVLENMKYQDIENLLALASDGIEQVQAGKRRRTFVDQDDDSDEWNANKKWNYVEICYTLNSGRKVSRVYHMAVDYGDTQSAVNKLYRNEGYQKGAFPVLNMTKDQVEAIRFRGEYANEDHKNEVCLKKLSDHEKAQFLETFQREFAAMSIEQMEKEVPVGLIRFSRAMDEEALDWWDRQEALEEESGEGYQRYGGYYHYWARDDLNRHDYYPVYPSCTETIRLLKEQGVKAGGYLDGLDVRAVRVYMDDNFAISYKDYEEAMGAEISVKDYAFDGSYFAVRDPERVEELRAVLVSAALCYYNPFYLSEPIDAALMVWDPDLDTADAQEREVGMAYEESSKGEWNTRVEVLFPKGKVPEFLWEKVEN